jgi:endoglucanase
MNRFYLKSLVLSLLPGVLIWMLVTNRPAQAQAPNYLHTEGHRILDANGNQVVLTGLNWFGLETESFAPHGLWARNLDSILDQIVELGFNTIRLPYSNQLFDPSSIPNGINYELNPDLEGLNGLEIMDKIIAGAGERGLKVILDRHRPDSHAQSELWYTSQYSEERWISDWVMLAERYSGDDTVIGVDLHNEPHGQATWGSEDPATDWRLAAERAGNAILEVNPNLLIIVQGVEQVQGDWYWWGGNLIGAREQPVRLNLPDRLVYSTHVYGPGVYPQPWFSDPSFPENMPGIWDRHWGYLQKEDIAPVIVGEFGGRSVGEDQEGIWQRALVSYLRENNISYIYWTLNPNSGDTGGILLDDWRTVDPDKEALLSGYQYPLIGIEQIGPEPASRLASPTPPVPTEQLASPTASAPVTLGLLYRNANTAENSQDSKPEFIIANRGSTPASLDNVDLLYWFNDDGDQPYVFHCDWAEIGCANVLSEFLTSPEGGRYLRIHFPSGLEPLLPGQDTGEIKVRFNRADWSEYRQADDYSFSPASEYTEWEQVTLAVNGQIVWGSGPGSTSMAVISPDTVTPVPATPTSGAPTLTAKPEETEAKEGNLPDHTLPSTTPTPQTDFPYSPPGPSWEKWTVSALTVFAAFAAGLLVAAIWLGRKKR